MTMPLYDYKCQECDKEFSQFLSVGDKLEHCDCARKSEVKRQYNFEGQLSENDAGNKAGKIVNDFIKEAKEEVKRHKEELNKGVKNHE